MGQARLRGTKEEREAAALSIKAAERAERQRKEQERERLRAERWAAMSKEERNAAFKRAQEEAAAYGGLASIMGHDAAMFLTYGSLGREE